MEFLLVVFRLEPNHPILCIHHKRAGLYALSIAYVMLFYSLLYNNIYADGCALHCVGVQNVT